MLSRTITLVIRPVFGTVVRFLDATLQNVQYLTSVLGSVIS